MRSVFACLVILLMLVQCRERYDLPLTVATGRMVVEGFIINGGKTSIRLSKTNSLDSRNLIPVKGALVSVVGDDNSMYPLGEQDSGLYILNGLNLNTSAKYKVDIRTQENKEYTSEFQPVIATPPIDTLTWTYDEKGLDIYVNANGYNNTRFYKWDYAETYEFESAFHSNLIFNVMPTGGPEPIVSLEFYSPRYMFQNDSIFTCWKTQFSSTVVIGSTEKLAQDLVYIPIIHYPKGAKELSKLYSVFVTQYSISKDAHDFFEKLKKNTESLGGLFDAQPSEITGNVTCVTDPSEAVIGYVEVTSQSNKRVFISNSDLPEWNYVSPCERIEVPNNPDALLNLYLQHLYPTSIASISMRGAILTIYVSPIPCVDCTTIGTNHKPDFWP